MTELRARVFISCGQRKDSAEVDIAEEIAKRLDLLGYDTYVAVQRQSLRSIRENIFAALRDTEYFLFVDFPRERLISYDGSQDSYRGSLFSHQELAIASYLNLDILAFQETSVRELDGILGHLQVNSFRFSDFATLPDLVESEVKRRWATGWRNSLFAALGTSPPIRAQIRDSEIFGYFYLLRVENAHRSTVARDCSAYIRSIVNVESGESLALATAELKWAGVGGSTVVIMPQSFRELDALWIPEFNPNLPQFAVLTDSTRHVPALRGPGKWKIDYEIISSNIAGASCELLLRLDGTIEGSRPHVYGTR